MSKRQWLIIFGFLVAILPFLGFPSNWDTVIFVIVGLLIVFTSYRLGTTVSNKTASPLPFTQHKNTPIISNPSSRDDAKTLE